MSVADIYEKRATFSFEVFPPKTDVGMEKLCGKELYLCYYCNNPAVMAECGFLSNPDEAAKLTDRDYQRQVAYTLFTGLNEFICG